MSFVFSYLCLDLTPLLSFFFFFFNDTAPTEIYTLSLHDALPISRAGPKRPRPQRILFPSPMAKGNREGCATRCLLFPGCKMADRKSTRLNSSHLGISYAVFCLKKKKNN